MKICKNEVEYNIESGLDYKQVFAKCGTTNPFGELAICDECQNDSEIMAEIKRHKENSDADNAWLRSAGWGER